MKFVAIGKGANEDYGNDIRGVPLRKKRENQNLHEESIISKVNSCKNRFTTDVNFNNLINGNNLFIELDTIKNKLNQINRIPSETILFQKLSHYPVKTNLFNIFKRKNIELKNKVNEDRKENEPTNLTRSISFAKEHKITQNSNSAKETTIKGQNIISELQTLTNKNFPSSTMMKLLISTYVS